jgi:hypothetical protein
VPTITADQFVLSFQVDTAVETDVVVYVGVKEMLTTLRQRVNVMNKNRDKRSKKMSATKQKSGRIAKNLRNRFNSGKSGQISPLSPSESGGAEASPGKIAAGGSHEVKDTEHEIVGVDPSAGMPATDENAGLDEDLFLNAPTPGGASVASSATSTPVKPVTVTEAKGDKERGLKDSGVGQAMGELIPEDQPLNDTDAAVAEIAQILRKGDFLYSASTQVPEGLEQTVKIGLPIKWVKEAMRRPQVAHAIVIQLIPKYNKAMAMAITPRSQRQTSSYMEDGSVDPGNIVPHAQLTFSTYPDDTDPTAIVEHFKALEALKFENQLLITPFRVRIQAELYGLEERPNDCVVCYARPKDTVSLPCRHCSICYTCHAKIYPASGCPVCRANITGLLRFTDYHMDPDGSGPMPLDGQ